MNVSIEGYKFLEVSNVYLSASDVTMFDNLSTFNLYVSGNSSQKLSYPEFVGVEVGDFLVAGERMLNFTFPQTPKTVGYVDVLVANEAGYGKLTESRLPFVSSWYGATEYQFPWVNGIEIFR